MKFKLFIFTILLFSCGNFQPSFPVKNSNKELVPCLDCKEQVELMLKKLRGSYLNLNTNDTIIFGADKKFKGIKRFTNFIIELDYKQKGIFLEENNVTLFGPETEYWNWYFINDTLKMSPHIYNNKNMDYDRLGKQISLIKIKE